MSGPQRTVKVKRRLPLVPGSRGPDEYGRMPGERVPGAPKTPAECRPCSGTEHAERPCPWVGCEHHMMLEVRPSGAIRFVHGPIDEDGLWVDETLRAMPYTCALDAVEQIPEAQVSELGCLEDIGRAMGLAGSRQGASQTEARALAKIKASSSGLLVVLSDYCDD